MRQSGASIVERIAESLFEWNRRTPAGRGSQPRGIAQQNRYVDGPGPGGILFDDYRIASETSKQLDDVREADRGSGGDVVRGRWNVERKEQAVGAADVADVSQIPLHVYIADAQRPGASLFDHRDLLRPRADGEKR
jgi:hypothetical protein